MSGTDIQRTLLPLTNTSSTWATEPSFFVCTTCLSWQFQLSCALTSFPRYRSPDLSSTCTAHPRRKTRFRQRRDTFRQPTSLRLRRSLAGAHFAPFFGVLLRATHHHFVSFGFVQQLDRYAHRLHRFWRVSKCRKVRSKPSMACMPIGFLGLGLGLLGHGEGTQPRGTIAQRASPPSKPGAPVRTGQLHGIQKVRRWTRDVWRCPSPTSSSRTNCSITKLERMDGSAGGPCTCVRKTQRMQGKNGMGKANILVKREK